MSTYSSAFKARMVAKMAGPGGPSANALAQEVGVAQTTLSRWLREAGDRVDGMKKGDRKKSKPKRPQDWTAEEKLQLVMESASLSDAELGELLRRRGVHSHQLEQWRESVKEVLERPRKRSRKSSAEARRIRELERELRRKDKALAEASALLVLKKKAQAIWGDEDDDTLPRNGK